MTSDGGVRFHVYLDGGTPEAPVHVVTASLLDAHMTPVAHWDTATLSSMPKTAFVNDYDYNKFGPGPFGIRAPLGAAATITLPPPASGSPQDAAYLQLTDVDGNPSPLPWSDRGGRWVSGSPLAISPFRGLGSRALWPNVLPIDLSDRSFEAKTSVGRIDCDRLNSSRGTKTEIIFVFTIKWR